MSSYISMTFYCPKAMYIYFFYVILHIIKIKY